MKNEKIFLGYITHSKSSYNPETFLKFVDFSQKNGLDLIFKICDQNLSNHKKLKKMDVAISNMAQLIVEYRWASHINLKLREVKFVFYFVKLILNLVRLSIIPNSRFFQNELRNRNRLIQITCAHVHLREIALSSGAAWTLIFEDDADFTDHESKFNTLIDLINKLNTFKDSHPGVNNLYCDVSNSYTIRELRLEKLVSELTLKINGNQIFHFPHGATNTLCASLVNFDMNSKLLDFYMEKLNSKYKFVPPDLLVNLFILQKVMKSDYKNYGFFLCQPGIFKQLSFIDNPKSKK